MRRYLLAGVAAAVTLTGLAGGVPAGAAAPGARAAAGARLWVARFLASYDVPTSAMAVSPGGGTVFVTGGSYGGRSTGLDYRTVAYSAASGRRLWARLYSSPGAHPDQSTAVAVSPDGATVFVTGYFFGSGYATVAYRAATGRLLWASRYEGPEGGDGEPSSVAVSPDGAAVYVTGWTGDSPSVESTVAYDAATGRQLWASTYGQNWPDAANSVAVSPDGAAVFVTGTTNAQGRLEYETIGYSAAAGRQLWARRYTAATDGGGCCVAVNPDGTAVFVTGASANSYTTLAYRAATGRQLWASRYTGTGDLTTGASSLAVSPDGTTVYVTGTARHGGITGYATIAYSAATGRQLWASRYRGGGATSMAVSPDGTTVYVTGSSGKGPAYATVAYRAATGRQLWARRYGPKAPAIGYQATEVAVSPDGATVFVTGYSSNNQGTPLGYITVAYRG